MNDSQTTSKIKAKLGGSIHEALARELEAQGWEVYVRHKRKYDTLRDRYVGTQFVHRKKVRSHGGSTVVALSKDDGRIEVFGRADCSDDDNFCRFTGRTLALSCALKTIAGMEAGREKALYNS